MSATLQDATRRKAIDAAREEARLIRIATELADEEERKRQWRVARGEVRTQRVSLASGSLSLPVPPPHMTSLVSVAAVVGSTSSCALVPSSCIL